MNFSCSNYSERQKQLLTAILKSLIEVNCTMAELNDVIGYVHDEAATISIIGSCQTTN